ncbi:MAG: biopolymer transport protein ExbD [Candidatus Atribacteria bacterium]|nr:biopolymer transport protein ExbD [Candidatus Atribacteria bacterium]
MFQFRRLKKKPKPEINMTPLVDVVLQLVIFFLVTTTFISVETGAQVNLPSANFSRIEEAQTSTITITEDNLLYFDGALTDWNELPSFVISEIRKDPQTTFVIEADKRVFHEVVVRAMDILKTSGAERIAIATQPPQEE